MVTLTVTYRVDAATEAAVVLNTATADSDETTPVDDRDDVYVVEYRPPPRSRP